MTVRLYLHTTPEDCGNPVFKYVEAWVKYQALYPGRATWGQCENNRLAIWIPFETDEEAAMFKLRNWRD